MSVKYVNTTGSAQLETLMALDGATKKFEWVDSGSVQQYLEPFDPFISIDAIGKRLARLRDAGLVVRKNASTKGRYVWRLSAKGKRKVQ